MARVGIIFGLLLCGLTFYGMVSSLSKIPTQFIPMMFGIPILFCGVVSLNPHRRKNAMNVALGIAALGAVAGGIRLLLMASSTIRGIEVNGEALRLTAAMSVICAAFVAICIFTLVTANRRKTPIQLSSDTLEPDRDGLESIEFSAPEDESSSSSRDIA